MPMINILKEVARGKRGARDLNYEESTYAAESILGRTASPAQIGAFLAAERIKLESVEELEAFVYVLRKYAHREPLFAEGLDCAGPYDGRKSSFIATFPTAFLLSAAGLPVTLHGTASLPPKWGITLQDIIYQSGIEKTALERKKAIAAANKSNVLFADAEEWCPPLGDLRSIREEIGMRTLFNTAEKLIDYACSPFIIFGIYHNTVFDRLSRLLIKLGYQKALIVQGVEGSDDLFIDRPTRVYTVENGVAALDIIDPEGFGLDTIVPEVHWTPHQQLMTAEAVLQGGGHMAFYNQTLLNGAARLHLAGKVNSIEEGLYTCKSLLDNGEAWSVYVKWRGALLGSTSGALGPA
ncbi:MULTISPECIES: anthranilate phosphoribosyltransferase [Paenibacillus]|uniref:Anthranilate phosphoribosyltransferase n=1 Tax=Paenibacillus odorifer TaxID=189426 RepID=A0A1R0XCL1_9BACL|nr:MULTISPECIES: anthranilate phosphoribosyltransferase [Paenibacillus]OMD32811.1 anthranilate phosphoribosyltransferase [Paenibacillus odorifer]OME34013.1 anthranilate phosphoribosyltransferase [Paenibacillus odorifer]OME38941.1 anthranilate phosphoribosyltransferase [Paenibacillus odorifer]OME63320.1 anthranilate phosphoribosyltransferase [Paenibacillus odorifer]